MSQRRDRFAGRARLLALALGCASCGPGVHTRAGGGVSALTVHDVDWNPTQAVVGRVRAVAEGAGVSVVFSDTGATVLSSGAVLAVDRSRTDWVGAAVIPSADDAGRWIVGIGGDGRLYRLKDRSRFEEVSARYGLEGEAIRSAASLGNGLVGFLLQRQVAIADGSLVKQYDTPGLVAWFGGGGSGLGLTTTGALMFDVAAHQLRQYELPGIRRAALGSDGRLYAATGRAIYATSSDGALSLAFDSQASDIGELVAARDTVWFSEGRELGVVAQGGVLETNTAPLSADAQLSAAANGDVWAISAGTLRRYSRLTSTSDRAAIWARSIAPIFARVCAGCHEPNGSTGIDLSSADAWEGERIEIRQRVIDARTMPPQGHELAESERATIAAWLQAGL